MKETRERLARSRAYLLILAAAAVVALMPQHEPTATQVWRQIEALAATILHRATEIAP